MTSLVSVLRQYAPVQMGGAVGPQSDAAFDVQSLQKDLRSVVERSDKFLWIWAASLVLLFALDCFVVLRQMSDPKMIGAIFAATGTGFVVVLVQMKRVWHEKFATETLISLLPALGPTEIREVVFRLLSVLVRKD